MIATTDRVAITESILLDAAREQGMTITGDRRVSEENAARLLGLAPGSLKNARHEGKGPVAYHRGFGGSKVSYRLRDLAEWIESARE